MPSFINIFRFSRLFQSRRASQDSPNSILAPTQPAAQALASNSPSLPDQPLPVKSVKKRDGNRPTGCRKHQSAVHDYFISYRVDRSPSDKAQSGLAFALHTSLEAAGDRLVAGGIRVYLDRLCIREGALWEEEFVAGLRGSQAVVLLLSRKSWDILVKNVTNGKTDNVLKEIELAIQCQKKIIPLCVKAEGDADHFDLRNENLSNLNSPNFTNLKQAVQALQTLPMIPVDSHAPQLAFYRVLSALHPAEISTQSLSGVPQPLVGYRTDAARMTQMLGSLAQSGHCILTGIGGIGKSTLAQMFVQFATAQRQLSTSATAADDVFAGAVLYERVFWINCRTAETAVGSLRAGFGTTDYDKTLKAFRKCVSGSGRFLFVFDGLDDTAVVDGLFEPLDDRRGGFTCGGDFIVTTRLERLPGGAFARAIATRSAAPAASIIKASLWSSEVVRAYLLDRCPALASAEHSLDVFDRFIERLGGYPIVIEQLVAYFNMKQPAVGDLELTLEAVLSDADNSRQTSLVELVRLSLKGLEETVAGRMAIMLFGCIGWLDGSRLQPQLLKACVKEIRKLLDEEDGEVDVLVIFKRLSTAGILRQVSVDGTYAVHNLHQTIIRDMAEKVTTVDTSGAYNASCAAYLGVMARTREFSTQQADMASHSQFLAGPPDRLPPGAESLLRLQMQCLDAALDRFFSRLESANTKLQRLVEDAAATLGTRQHALVASVLHELGATERRQGRYVDGMRHLQEALDVRVAVHGTRVHAEVAATVGAMGLIALRQGRYEDALAHFHEALDTTVAVFGTRVHDEAAAALGGMGGVAVRQGQYAAALEYFREALDITAKVLGTRVRSEVGNLLNNMGVAALRLGRYGESSRYYREAHDIFVEVYGTREHASVAGTLHGLGLAAMRLGDFEQARAIYTESLVTQEKVFGTRVHEEVAATLRFLGEAALAQGHLDEAFGYLSESLDIKVRVFGTRRHGSVAKSLAGLGRVAQLQGRDGEALGFCREALQTYVEVYGTRVHDDVAEVLRILGGVHLAERQYGSAIECFEESLAIMDKTAPSHSDIGKIKESLRVAREGLSET
ncbi:hypothetical protein DFJ73DRAFT_664585 [Zopfochytrium polystomum]|nr:hypothetical protein DFJ73DRAFT_664585 [Zopfochytrium polystomum]